MSTRTPNSLLAHIILSLFLFLSPLIVSSYTCHSQNHPSILLLSSSSFILFLSFFFSFCVSHPLKCHLSTLPFNSFHFVSLFLSPSVPLYAPAVTVNHLYMNCSVLFTHSSTNSLTVSLSLSFSPSLSPSLSLYMFHSSFPLTPILTITPVLQFTIDNANQ